MPPAELAATVGERLARIRGRIAAACARAGRKPEEVTLIGASKQQPLAALAEAYAAGLRDFGENRVQEGQRKAPELPADAVWHLIGPLQTNKLARALELFAAIHSLDRDSLARKLAPAVQARGACPTLFVQVNTGREPQKAGVDPDALDGFLAEHHPDRHAAANPPCTMRACSSARERFSTARG